MTMNDILRVIAICISVLAGIRWAVALVPKQIADITRFANGYRAFKRKLNWLSLSLFALIMIAICLDLSHLYKYFDMTGAMALLRSLMILNVVTMLIHVYNYKCKEEDTYGFGGKQQPKEE